MSMSEFNFTVIYKNGDMVTLNDKTSWDHVDHDNIKAMRVSIKKSQLFTLHLEEGQKLIYRRRGLATTGVPEEKSPHPIIYIIGWRQKIGGQDVQSITYICDWVGRGFQIHQAGKFDEKHPWFYAPALHKHEVWSGDRYYDTKTQTTKTKE